MNDISRDYFTKGSIYIDCLDKSILNKILPEGITIEFCKDRNKKITVLANNIIICSWITQKRIDPNGDINNFTFFIDDTENKKAIMKLLYDLNERSKEEFTLLRDKRASAREDERRKNTEKGDTALKEIFNKH